MAVNVQDINGSALSVGDVVNVRCTITASSGFGSGSRLTLVVETPGLVGQASGVTLQVSPSQCRKAASNRQLGSA